MIVTNIVEAAVYKEFEAISECGGVLGAMDTMYQRGKIQEECMHYEHKKHDGSLPLKCVNMFLPKVHDGEIATKIEPIRSVEEEKGQLIENVKDRQAARDSLAPKDETSQEYLSDASEENGFVNYGRGLQYLQTTARERRNVFEVDGRGQDAQPEADQPCAV